MAYGAAVRGVPGGFAGDGGTGRVGNDQSQLRAGGQRRLLRDADEHLESGRVRRLPTNPPLQLKWFIDQALAVKAARLPTDPGYGATEARRGEWIADVERPRSRTEAPTSRAPGSPAS